MQKCTFIIAALMISLSLPNVVLAQMGELTQSSAPTTFEIRQCLDDGSPS